VQIHADFGQKTCISCRRSRHEVCTLANDFDKNAGCDAVPGVWESEATMGGFGSTRWQFARTRQDTDPLMALDVRWLKRIGALRPGAVAFPHWTSRGEPSGDISTYAGRDGSTLMLMYRTRRPGEEWRPVEATIDLDATPCHYGGERTWFLCPGCGSRRAVLFSVNGLFRCRGCHDLAYSSTREGALDRSHRRVRALQKRLGGGGYGVPVWDIPARPPRMHWHTYERLVHDLRWELHRQDGMFDQWLSAREALLDRLSKWG
jgi:hypothetical protein